MRCYDSKCLTVGCGGGGCGVLGRRSREPGVAMGEDGISDGWVVVMVLEADQGAWARRHGSSSRMSHVSSW
jgi:hypothetical protein